MTNNHDIFRNKRDFAHEEFATELYKPKGKPKDREPKEKPENHRTNHKNNY